MDNVGLPIHGPLPFKHAVWFGTKPNYRGEVAVITAKVGTSVMNASSRWQCGYANTDEFPDLKDLTPRDTEILDTLATHARYPAQVGDGNVPGVIHAFAGATALLSGEQARHRYLDAYVSRHAWISR